jgi:hypothetical protein
MYCPSPSAFAVSTTGKSIPPLFLSTVIFIQLKHGLLLTNLSLYFRVHFKEYFLNGAHLGSAEAAYKSGWMSDQDFLLFMKHLHTARSAFERERSSFVTRSSAVSV